MEGFFGMSVEYVRTSSSKQPVQVYMCATFAACMYAQVHHGIKRLQTPPVIICCALSYIRERAAFHKRQIYRQAGSGYRT